MSDERDDLGLDDGGVAGEALPECGEHCGTCARCGLEIKSKPRKRLQGEARAQRKTVSFRVPDDAERGSEVFDALLLACKEELVERGLKADIEELSTYVTLTAVMGSWLTS